MRKRLLSAAVLPVLLCVLLAGLHTPAMAAGQGMGSFAAVRTYDGRFGDVPASAWYYRNVASLYELGLTDGQSAASFGAARSVSLAETVSFAARIHSTYYLGSAEAGPGQFEAQGAWYTPYVRYLRQAGVLDGRFEGLYARPATRAQAAYILSRTLPASEFDARNDETLTLGYRSGRYIPDVTSATPCAENILTLYRWGVAAGSGDRAAFQPAATLRRSELAAMLTRMVDPSQRITLDWDLDAVTYADLVQGTGRYTPAHAVNDTDAIAGNVQYIFKKGLDTLELKLEPAALTSESLNTLMENYLRAARFYVEQGYAAVECAFDARGNVTLRFQNPYGGDRDLALQRAVAIRDRLWANGTLNSAMTQREIAWAYCSYLARICQYDASDQGVRHTAYGALINGRAACDGYTAAFNIFLKLEGISCGTAVSPNHIWTTATLDGTLYHIDATWTDQSYGMESRYFCMTPEYAMSRSGL